MNGVLISDAAERLGVTTKVVRRALRRYSIKPDYIHSNCMILSHRQFRQLKTKLAAENRRQIAVMEALLERWEAIE